MLTELGKCLKDIRSARGELLFHMARKLDLKCAQLSSIVCKETELDSEIYSRLLRVYHLTIPEIERLKSFLVKGQAEHIDLLDVVYGSKSKISKSNLKEYIACDNCACVDWDDKENTPICASCSKALNRAKARGFKCTEADIDVRKVQSTGLRTFRTLRFHREFKHSLNKMKDLDIELDAMMSEFRGRQEKIITESNDWAEDALKALEEEIDKNK